MKKILPSPADLRAPHQQRSGLINTNLTEVIDLPGLTRAALGQTLFCRVYHCMRMAAEHYAPNAYDMRVVRDPVTHEKTGYRIRVANRLARSRIFICYDLALQCRPMPWVDQPSPASEARKNTISDEFLRIFRNNL